MSTAASPVCIRDHALAIVAKHLTAEPDLQASLCRIPGATMVNLLLDLERRFDIGLDVDEVLPNGTIGVLVELVVLRACGGDVPRLYHWDDERLSRGLPYFGGRPRLIERPPVDCAPPAWPEPATRGPSLALRAFEASSAKSLADDPRTACADRPSPPCAVPSDEAWALALDVHAREERARTRILVAACVVVPFALGAGGWWLHSLGLI